jgi:hypothetical protein
MLVLSTVEEAGRTGVLFAVDTMPAVEGEAGFGTTVGSDIGAGFAFGCGVCVSLCTKAENGLCDSRFCCSDVRMQRIERHDLLLLLQATG